MNFRSRTAPHRRKSGSVASVIVLAIAALAIIGVLLMRSARGSQSVDDVAAHTCRADYARARSAIDTATIDLRRPITSRAQAPVALTCGALRTTGRLIR